MHPSCPPCGVARFVPEGAPYTREIPKQKATIPSGIEAQSSSLLAPGMDGVSECRSGTPRLWEVAAYSMVRKLAAPAFMAPRALFGTYCSHMCENLGFLVTTECGGMSLGTRAARRKTHRAGRRMEMGELKAGPRSLRMG